MNCLDYWLEEVTNEPPFTRYHIDRRSHAGREPYVAPAYPNCLLVEYKVDCVDPFPWDDVAARIRTNSSHPTANNTETFGRKGVKLHKCLLPFFKKADVTVVEESFNLHAIAGRYDGHEC